MPNENLTFTLDEAVAEVLGLLTGLNITYEPEQDRYYTIVRAINRALRSVATENEWSYYASNEDIGLAHAGVKTMDLRPTIRPRIMIDDSVKLCRMDDDGNFYPVVWAAFLPREAIDNTPNRSQLWVAHTKSSLEFSRPFYTSEEGLHVTVPVMREPEMFRLPPRPEDPNAPFVDVPDDTREQLVDFEYPDLIVLKASYFYAQTQPIMQPRSQTLDQDYKNLMYSLVERDTRMTDAPLMHPYFVPVQSDIFGNAPTEHRPHGEFRWYDQ